MHATRTQQMSEPLTGGNTPPRVAWAARAFESSMYTHLSGSGAQPSPRGETREGEDTIGPHQPSDEPVEGDICCVPGSDVDKRSVLRLCAERSVGRAADRLLVESERLSLTIFSATAHKLMPS